MNGYSNLLQFSTPQNNKIISKQGIEIYISFNSKKAQIFACQFVTETIRGRIEKDNIILYTFLSLFYIFVLPWPKPIMLVIFYTCVPCEHAHASSSSSYGCRIIIGVCLMLLIAYQIFHRIWFSYHKILLKFLCVQYSEFLEGIHP